MAITDEQLRQLGVDRGSARGQELTRRFANRPFRAARSTVTPDTQFGTSRSAQDMAATRAGAANTGQIASDIATVRGAGLPTSLVTSRTSSGAATAPTAPSTPTDFGVGAGQGAIDSLSGLKAQAIQSFRPESFTQQLLEKMQEIHDRKFKPLTESRQQLFQNLLNLGVSEADAIRASTIRSQIADIDRQLSTNETRINQLADNVRRGITEDKNITLQTIQTLIDEQNQLQNRKDRLDKEERDFGIKELNIALKIPKGTSVVINGKRVEGLAEPELADVDVTMSRAQGILIDKNRQPILDEQGNTIPFKESTSVVQHKSNSKSTDEFSEFDDF